MSKYLTFSEAIDQAKAGKLIQRKGWNGKDMFVFMRPGDSLPSNILLNAKSLPESLKTYFKKKHETIWTKDLDFRVYFGPYLCMKTADDSIVNGWLASQTDILSNDWITVTPESLTEISEAV